VAGPPRTEGRQAQTTAQRWRQVHDPTDRGHLLEAHAGAFPMIGRMTRGTDARRLLYYLYRPGTANERIDLHLVAGFSDQAELDDARRIPWLAAAGRTARPARPRSTATTTPSRCGAARSGPRRKIDCCPTPSRRGWQPRVTARTGLAPAGDDQAVQWVAAPILALAGGEAPASTASSPQTTTPSRTPGSSIHHRDR
jgi:hypothetical protein